MERSLAGLLARPLGLGVAAPRSARPPAPGRLRARRAQRRGAVVRGRPPSSAPGRALAGAHALADVAAAVWHRRASRLALIAAAVLAIVVGGGYELVRRTPLSAVSHVRVSGLQGPESQAIEAALTRSAHGMSTLGVDTAALRAAVAPFRVVSGLHASASFPHSLRISISEQPPVAALSGGGGHTAVAADGTVLGPALLSSSLPTLEAPATPAPGQFVSDLATREALIVLGAAPRVLARHVARAFRGPRGLTIAMSNGLQVYFGDSSLPHAKWRSLAVVLADPSSAGAHYIDVRVPSRPAAGFAPGSAPPVAPGSPGGAGGTALDGSREARISALAAALAGTTGVSNDRATAEEEASSEKRSEASSEKGSGSEAKSESGSAGGGEASQGSEAQTPQSAETPASGEHG